MPVLKKVLVIGRGLIGGSFALDMKRCGLAQSILFHDLVGQDSVPLSAIVEVDLVVFATPVEAIPELVRACKPYLNEKMILMDVASTKSKLIEDLKPILGAQISQFIFAHPIAGKAKSGFAEAEAGLFATKPVIMTPLAETHSDMLEQIRQIWQAMGAEVILMSPSEHDAFYGRYSHLSNLLAYVLKRQLTERDQRQFCHLLPPSFKAMTRLADSSPEMWRDICMSNQSEILKAIHTFQKDLSQLELLIQDNNPSALLDYLSSK